LDKFCGRLNSRKNKYASIGGHMALVYLVLNSGPIFYLFYMKMMPTMKRNIMHIQREFLLGGARGGQQIN